MYRVFAICCLLAFPAQAEMPVGYDAPAFTEAVEAWLDADDAASLPEFARLAREGNLAAQILLGRIDQERRALSPWLASMSAKERKALLRAPGGKFPKSWLRVASETSRLAAALQASRFQENDKQTLPELIALGEIRAARFVADRLFNHGHWEFLIETIPGSTRDPYLTNTALTSAFYVQSNEAARLRKQAMSIVTGGSLLLGENQADLVERLLAIGRLTVKDEAHHIGIGWIFWGHAKLHTMEQDVSDNMVNQLVSQPEAGPIVVLCDQACPDSGTACIKLGNYLARGVYMLRKIGSPVESLLSTPRYRKSRRAQEDLLGQMAAQAAPFVRRSAEHYHGIDRCLASLVQERVER